MEPKRTSDIKTLNPIFAKRFALRWKICQKYRPDAVIFESKRTFERQCFLVCQGRTNKQAIEMGVPVGAAKAYCRKGNKISWTLNSNHLTGNAVDVVFTDDEATPQIENRPMRKGPYPYFITLGEMYGLKNLSPDEQCHFENNFQSIDKVIERNSKRWENTKDEEIRKLLHEANEDLRKIS